MRSSSCARRLIGVAISPGQTTLQRIPSRAYVTAIARVRPTTPAFDAAYACVAKSSSPPTRPRTEATVTIAPPPFARRSGTACLQKRKTERRFASSTASQASSVQVSTGPSPSRRPLMPCAQTRASSPSSAPKRGRVVVDVEAVTAKPASSNARTVAEPMPPLGAGDDGGRHAPVMAEPTSALDRIREERLVAILRRVPDVDAVVERCLAGGIRVVEITLDSDDALGTIDGCASERRPHRARRHRAHARGGRGGGAAGAEACVSPALVPEMVARCRRSACQRFPAR